MVPALQGFDPKGFYHVSWVGLVAIVYNSSKVSTADAPKDWPDLADPKWKDLIAFGSPNYSGMVGVWTVAMEQNIRLGIFQKAERAEPADRPVHRRCSDRPELRRAAGRGRQPRQRAPQRRQRQPARGQLPDLRHAFGALAIGDHQRTARARTPPSCSWSSWPARNTRRSWPIISSSRCAPTCRRRRDAKSLAEIKLITPDTGARSRRCCRPDKQKWKRHVQLMDRPALSSDRARRAPACRDWSAPAEPVRAGHLDLARRGRGVAVPGRPARSPSS